MCLCVFAFWDHQDIYIYMLTKISIFKTCILLFFSHTILMSMSGVPGFRSEGNVMSNRKFGCMVVL